MYRNIIYIGGINFVDKAIICKQICEEFGLEYLSANELSISKENHCDHENNKDNNIYETSIELIQGLKNIVQQDKYYLLDWHYCHLNYENEVVRIPYEIIKSIDPISLNLIIVNIDSIKDQLEEKDNIEYSYELLERLQYNEMIHARMVSEQLGIELNVGTQHDFSKIKLSLQNAPFT